MKVEGTRKLCFDKRGISEKWWDREFSMGTTSSEIWEASNKFSCLSKEYLIW